MTSKTTSKDKIKTKAHSQDSIPSFIRKTYDILEERKFPDIIDWNPEGTALVIKKPSEFCQKVLPTYFKHNNLTSFVRQLNMYNFHKRRTQNIDHVYYHELFQKGKKHLLKEIKRKNHEDKTPKVEPLDASQSGKDLSSLMYENQLLKRLYNDAISKVTHCEGQIKELSNQNQSLWQQLCQKNEGIQKPFIEVQQPTAMMTPDQVPMTFNGEVCIPPLNITPDGQLNVQYANIIPMVKVVPVNAPYYVQINPDNSNESTEVSHNSPLHPASDKCSDMTAPPSIQYSQEMPCEMFQPVQMSLPQQMPQCVQQSSGNPSNELFISRQDLSVGPVFTGWNPENVIQNNQEAVVMGYGGQAKVDKAYINTQQSQLVFQDPNSLLGKRPLEIVGPESQVHMPEPLSKQLCVFNQPGLISTGTEEKENFRVLKRDSAMNEEYEVGVDLMDFNPVFNNNTWTKAA